MAIAGAGGCLFVCDLSWHHAASSDPGGGRCRSYLDHRDHEARLRGSPEARWFSAAGWRTRSCCRPSAAA